MRLVLIEWRDSWGCSSSWQSIEECKPDAMVCRSVGWLLYDGDDCKVVVPHLSDERAQVPRQGCGDMTIPTCAIVKMTDLADHAAA